MSLKASRSSQARPGKMNDVKHLHRGWRGHEGPKIAQLRQGSTGQRIFNRREKW
jgi:hypothetical protein